MSRLRSITDRIYSGNDIDKKMQANEIYYKAADWIRSSYPDRYEDLIDIAEDILYDYDLDWAQSVVRNMKPYGEFWDYDTICRYLENHGIRSCCKDYYLAMNMACNDYRQVADNCGIDLADFCFGIADRFINDEDAPSHKLAKYFTLM